MNKVSKLTFYGNQLEKIKSKKLSVRKTLYFQERHKKDVLYRDSIHSVMSDIIYSFVTNYYLPYLERKEGKVLLKIHHLHHNG